MQKTAIFLIALLLAVSAMALPAAAGDGQVGSEAADFSLQDLDGVTHTLSDYQNKVVFFYVAGWG